MSEREVIGEKHGADEAGVVRHDDLARGVPSGAVE